MGLYCQQIITVTAIAPVEVSIGRRNRLPHPSYKLQVAHKVWWRRRFRLRL
jgi:hypothetical protein